MISKPTGLDAIIAEKVMGWKWDAHWAGGCWILPGKYRHWNSGEPHVTPPNFSGDIADAWQVVEKLRLTVQPDDTSTTTSWAAGTKQSNDIYWDILAEANTAPLAICLAALKVVGVAVD